MQKTIRSHLIKCRTDNYPGRVQHSIPNTLPREAAPCTGPATVSRRAPDSRGGGGYCVWDGTRPRRGKSNIVNGCVTPTWWSVRGGRVGRILPADTGPHTGSLSEAPGLPPAGDPGSRGQQCRLPQRASNLRPLPKAPAPARLESIGPWLYPQLIA